MASGTAYCFRCQALTETVEDIECQVVCTECGVVVGDIAIQDPGSKGESFEQRNNLSGDHWSSILGDPNLQNRHLLTALRKEDSRAGEAYRRSLADRSSVLYSTISASLDSVSSKLGLNSSLAKKAKELWYDNRHYGRLKGKEQDGVSAKVKVSHEAAPVLGIACIYWVCQNEDLPITSSRLAEVADIRKASLLKAYMSLQKAVGHPGRMKDSEIDTLNTAGSADEIRSLLRAMSAFLVEETELLVECLCLLQIVNEDLRTDLTLVVGFLLHYKFPRPDAATHRTLQNFCKFNKVDFRSRWTRLQDKINKILQILSREFDRDADNQTNRFVLDHSRDFVKLMELYDRESLPVELSTLVPVSLTDIEN